MAVALRCGVVGMGRGKLFARILAENEHCELVAVCDTDSAAMAEHNTVARHTDYNEFLAEGLDVVAVISPGPVHADQSIAALMSGAHVLCETPCVYSIEEAKAVVGAVRLADKSYMLAENYIWQGWCEALRSMANDGLFGDIVYAEGDYTHDLRDIMLYDEKGRVPYAESEGKTDLKRTWRATDLPPIVYCSHTLGPLLHLMQDRVVSAYGLAVTNRGMPGIVETDLESGLFQTEKGAVIRLTNGFTPAHPFSLFYSIAGTKGSGKILNAGGQSGKWWSDQVDGIQGWQDLPEDVLKRPDGRDDTAVMVDAFIQSIVDGVDPPLDVHASLDMTLPGIVAHQSGVDGGRRMDVPNSRDWV